MKKTLILFAISIGLSLPWISSQAHPTTAPPCNPNKTQMDLNQCAAKELKKSDKILNQLYKKIMTRNANSPRAKKNMVKAQLAWIKYRDAACFYESDKYRGGSIQPLIRLSCMSTLTKERNAHFKNELKNPS